MKKIVLSLSMIAVVAVVVIGATGAFFSDTETSSGNTFTAGAIDLKVGSAATYNGVTANYGVWGLTDLAAGNLFFNLADIKPGDTGSNRIDLNVNNNPAWSCATIKVTADDDNTCTGPEMKDDSQCNATPGVFNGDMASNLSFVWWPDYNNNGLMDQPSEVAGKFFLSGTKLASMLAANKSVYSSEDHQLNLTIADSKQNFFGDLIAQGSPLLGQTTYSVGTAWCMGDMSIATNGTISCNGAPVTNASQTDSLKADMSFSAVQQRNNPTFRCEDTYRPN